MNLHAIYVILTGKQQKVGSVRVGAAKLSEGPGVLKTSGQVPKSTSNSSKTFQIYQETGKSTFMFKIWPLKYEQ